MPSDARMSRSSSGVIACVCPSGSEITSSFISKSPNARLTLSSPLMRLWNTLPLAASILWRSSERFGVCSVFSYCQLPFLLVKVAIESPMLATVRRPLSTRPSKQVAPSGLQSWRAIVRNSSSIYLKTIKRRNTEQIRTNLLCNKAYTVFLLELKRLLDVMFLRVHTWLTRYWEIKRNARI